MYIRELFEANKDIKDPRQQRASFEAMKRKSRS